MNILTINAGSSSIKYKAFIVEGHVTDIILSGLIEGIGESVSRWHHYHQGTKSSTHHYFADHHEAFSNLAQRLKNDLIHYPINAIGHRVVHGGTLFYQPTIIDATVLAEIKNLVHLAPIHNTVNAQGIEFAQIHYPETIQIAIFDSGFHHSMPDYASHYAIDREIAARYQIKRYGFHGINHEYVARKAAVFLQKPMDSCHFISLHLGNGASGCLIKNGQSCDTTMGMTPLAGLIMGTRCGDIDPGILLYLLDQGLTGSEIDILLNKKSGLQGLAEDNDMRRVLMRSESGDLAAQLAINMYVYSIQKTIGAYMSQLETLDALIFTGGVGENAVTIREKILSPLTTLGFQIDSKFNALHHGRNLWAISKQGHRVLVIRGDEELLMAQKVAEILKTQP